MTHAVETFDNARLQAYLEQHVGGFKGPMTTEKFSGGQSNPTFKVTAASGVYVLRRQPLGKLLKSAHAVVREFRVLQALANTSVPVPQVYHLCEDPSIIGSLFYVMAYCEGNIYWDAAIPEIDAPTRTHIYNDIVDTLATLHQVDIAQVGLADYGKHGSYFERQLERWTTQYRASEIDRIAPMETLIAWLNLNLPADDGRVALVHGDYRLDNLVFAPDNSRIIAILDWELSTLGHPFADVGYLCMLMRMPQIPGSISGLKGMDLAQLGIPTEQDIVARY